MEWIDVDDKLPRKNGHVIVNWHRKGRQFKLRDYVKTSWYEVGYKFSGFHGYGPLSWGLAEWEITHWMPLPEPPNAK